MKTNSITGAAKACFIKNMVPAFFGAMILLSLIVSRPEQADAQASPISYASPQTYTIGRTISPLSPTGGSTGAPVYSTSTILLSNDGIGPSGVAVDAAGNIFMSATFMLNYVVELPANSTEVIFVGGQGFNLPRGIVLDAAGNVYVADYNNNQVKEILVGGTTSITLGSGFNHPYDVAVDAKGNVYVADYGNNLVKEIPVNGGAIITLGSGFSGPTGVSVDAYGNVYVADHNNNAIKKIPAGNGAPVTLGSGFSSPYKAAVDGSGNIFVTDYGNKMVKMIPADGSAIQTVGSGYNSLFDLTLDAANNVIVADSGAEVLEEIKPVNGFYINPALPAGLNFNGTTGVISGTPTAAAPAANYTVTAYNAGSFSQATVNIQVSSIGISYASPQIYNVGTAITPLAPTSVGVAAPGYSTTAVTFASGFNAPLGIALDAAGNVYVADAGNNLVKKIPAGGGTPVAIGSGFSGPHGVAVDAAGNVYVADRNNNAIKEIPVGGGSPVTLGSGFSNPFAVALDAAGNIYVADYGNNVVKKIPAGNGAPVTIGTGFSSPTGVAVDAAGNVFVSDFGHGLVAKIPAGGGSPVTVGSGFNFPMGVAVDPAGDVFVCQYGNTTLMEIPAGGGSVVSLGPTLVYQYAAAVDAMGDIFVADWGNNAVKEIKPVGGYHLSKPLPAGLAFNPATGVISGTPTVISPATTYTITAYNSQGSATANIVITVNGPLPQITYNNPQTYIVGTAISPLAPTNSGAPVSGYGGPFLLGSGFNRPLGVAVDAAGNVYVDDTFNNLVKKIPANGGAIVKLDSLGQPGSIAVDAAGNVYVPDLTNDVITKIPAGGGAPVTFGSGFNIASGIAVDSNGNIYYSDAASAVKMIPAGGGATVTVATGFNLPQGLAIDAAGNIYVADYGNHAVKKIPAGSSAPATIGSGFSGPYGVATDAAGNVYVSDQTAHAIKMIPAGSNTPVVLTTAINTPAGIAIDATGNIYIADLGNSAVEELKRGSYYISPALPAGLIFNSNTGVISGTPTAASAATTYTVVAYNSGGASTSTVNITVLSPTANAGLSNLTISNGALTPSFTAGTTSYSVSEANSVASVTVKPTASDAGATIKVNGIAVASGSASQSLPLAAGSNTISVVVTASDGVTTKTYSINVSRAPSGIATLSSIGSSITPLTPIFNSATTSYTLSVSNANATMTVKPVTTDAGASIKVNGAALTPGTTSAAIALAEGTATAINVTVTAQDGTTTKTYTITVTRAPSNNATLTSVGSSVAPLTPVFNSATTSYTLSVPYATATMTLKPVTADANATVKVNGTALATGTTSAAIPLVEGTTTAISVVVTAQDGTTIKTYTITVTRAPSNIATLSAMGPGIGPLTPVFTPNTTSYTLSVAYATATMTVKPVTTDANATIKVNGTALASGTTSPATPLTEGTTTAINVAVTAQNGTTIKTYTITVTRAPSNVATLSAIGSSITPLTPIFNSNTTGYTLSVPNGTQSMTVKPISTDANATIKVNGTATPSGSTFGPIALAVGSNTISALVTAQDGATTKTYTITVTRASGGADGFDQGISVTKPIETLPIAFGTEDGILIHQAVSPNGDGVNDFLQIDNISQYPDNKLTIMNRNGQLIFEAKGYDNSSKVFDGHSNKNGQMQLPGTYFYQLDYTVNAIVKHKTGFILLKY